MAAPRRTSRNPARDTPEAARAKRISSTLRSGKGTGTLHYKGLHAKIVKGDPVLAGRIALDRGTGVTEFPSPEQFRIIARQEKIPPEIVERAFGHLMPAPKRRTSKRRKRTSKNRPAKGWFSGLFKNARRTSKIRRNAKPKRVRQDEAFAPRTRKGEPIPLRAATVAIPINEIEFFGAEHGIYIDAGGRASIEPYSKASRTLSAWLTQAEIDRAFGHLRGSLMGETPKRRKIPTHYNVRSMRLGHREEPGQGPPKGGIVKGQLVMFHKPSKAIVWQAYDDSKNNPDKPIWIWYGASKGHFDLSRAMAGAKLGTGDSRELVGATDRGIPPIAMLDAFGHLLPAAQRREAYRTFGGS